jgi:hypothetical protein
MDNSTESSLIESFLRAENIGTPEHPLFITRIDFNAVKVGKTDVIFRKIVLSDGTVLPPGSA